ncbi:MAG: hypothetical protein HWE25_03585 [Alphaproteobacteria bacterium]|nr:hypothetical protein [Alphaproteobacteria bacterium]
MKLLYETADYSEALVLKALIEQAGYFVHLDGFNATTAMPHLTAGIGLRLWVHEGEHAEVSALIADTRSENLQDKATDESLDECPSCGSENVVRYSSMWLLPILWVMNLLYPVPPGNRRACRDCGCRFKSKGPTFAGPLRVFLLLWLVLFLTVFAFEAYYFWQEGPGLERYCPPGWFCD